MDTMEFVMHSPPEQSAPRPLYSYHHQPPRCPYRASHIPYPYDLPQAHHHHHRHRPTNAYDPVHSIPAQQWPSYHTPHMQSSPPAVWNPSQPQPTANLSPPTHQQLAQGHSAAIAARHSIEEHVGTQRTSENPSWLPNSRRWIEQPQSQPQPQPQIPPTQSIHNIPRPEQLQPNDTLAPHAVLEITSQPEAMAVSSLPVENLVDNSNENFRRSAPIIGSRQHIELSQQPPPPEAGSHLPHTPPPSGLHRSPHQSLEQQGQRHAETTSLTDTGMHPSPQDANALASGRQPDELSPLIPDASQRLSGSAIVPPSPPISPLADQATHSSNGSSPAALVANSSASPNATSPPVNSTFANYSRTSPPTNTHPYTQDTPMLHTTETANFNNSNSNRSGRSTPSLANSAILEIPVMSAVQDQRRISISSHRQSGTNYPLVELSLPTDHGSDDEVEEQHTLQLLEQFSNSLYPGTSPAADDRIRAQQILRGALTNKRVASKSAIASLQSVDLNSLEPSERMCIICYNDFGKPTPEGISEAPLRLPKCKHVFGDHCIKKWFEESDSCPYCRDKVQSESQLRAASQAIHQYLRAHQQLASRRGAMAANTSGVPSQETYTRMPSHRDRGALPDMSDLFYGGHTRLWASGERRGPVDEPANDSRRRTRARHGVYRVPYSPAIPLTAPSPGPVPTTAPDGRRVFMQPLAVSSPGQAQFAPQIPAYPQTNHQVNHQIPSPHPFVMRTQAYQAPGSHHRHSSLSEQQRLSVWPSGSPPQPFVFSEVGSPQSSNSSRNGQSYGAMFGSGPGSVPRPEHDAGQPSSSRMTHTPYPGAPFTSAGADTPTAFLHAHTGQTAVLPPPSVPTSGNPLEGRGSYTIPPYNTYNPSTQPQAPMTASEVPRLVSGIAPVQQQPTVLPPISAVEARNEFPQRHRNHLANPWMR